MHEILDLAVPFSLLHLHLINVSSSWLQYLFTATKTNVLNMCILLARNWHSSAKYILSSLTAEIHKQLNSSLRWQIYILSKYHEPSPHISYETSYLFIGTWRRCPSPIVVRPRRESTSSDKSATFSGSFFSEAETRVHQNTLHNVYFFHELIGIIYSRHFVVFNTGEEKELGPV